MTNLEARYDHVIIGGGVAADSAARAIRTAEPDATIAILSADPHSPVYRPALSKDLWTGEDPDPESQELHTAEETGATLFTSTLVTELLPHSHSVVTARGQLTHYKKALLATGSSARHVPDVHDDRVVCLRTVGDYRHLRGLAKDGARIVVVGGGYIGTEIAAALTRTGAQVTLAHAGQHLLEHMFPASITGHLEQTFSEHGITVVPGFRLLGIDTGDELVLHSGAAESLHADAAVLGLGAELNTNLAEHGGLDLDLGAVVVDPYLRTSAPDVYAAGDVALFDDPLLGLRHVEHVDHAQASGAAAGKNMAGAEEAYEYTPLFFSDLFDDGYEAVGRLDASMEMREVWNQDRIAAVVHYLEDGRVEGVLLWNTWDSVDRAREVIAASQNGQLTPEELDGQIAPG
ncbi:N-acylamino acid racemase [Brachybacterium vulturis]|uniref:N-acylamino acid racemase n=1 Tax=Brachybacterium vulturis TaxID=2017484 RepID=A0A291GJ65_9MICO|nr:FAD-dependent oxidoreductase [Brachybacterium vulturis]ATG50228.1 N-acylamino acid racemase [Brachybacterium vulturis]